MQLKSLWKAFKAKSAPGRRDCQRDGGTEARHAVQQGCDVANLTQILMGLTKTEVSDTSGSAAEESKVEQLQNV